MTWTKTSTDTWRLDDKWSVRRHRDSVGSTYSVIQIDRGREVKRAWYPLLKHAKAEAEHLRRKKDVRGRILDVCKQLISSGLAFGYKKDLKEPEYTAERGLAEIENILREER